MKLSAAKIKQKAMTSSKTAAMCALEFGAGFLLANISTAQSFAPFGIAYAASCNIFGLFGTVLGYLSIGYDFWRYLIAAMVAFVARRVMKKVLELTPQIGAFFYAAWGGLVGGVGGIFIYTYTFRENLLFILSGIISGLFAYVFAVARLSSQKKIAVSEKINYICFFVFASVLLIGVLALGELFSSVAVVLCVFLLLCVCGKCGFLYAAGGSLFLSFALCLYNTSYLWLAGVLVLGTVFASVLRDLGKNSQVLGFLLSNVLVGIYYSGSFNIWSMLANIVIAGIIYTFLPKKTLERVLNNVLPVSKKKGNLLLRRRKIAHPSGTTKQRLDRLNENEITAGVCKKCPDKMLCWIKNYDKTVLYFNKLPREILSPALRAPSELLSFCRNSEKIVAAERKIAVADEKAFTLDFSKTTICKNGEHLCGDTSNVFITSDSRCVLTISDGMGSGTAAANESAEVSRLLENLIKKGFDKSDALFYVNTTLLANENESVAAVDMLFIDLLNGRGQLIKANGAPTYVFRENNVYEIGKASAPLGALEKIEYGEQSCRFVENDIIVMVSDGFDCENGQKVVEEGCRKMTDCLSAATKIASACKNPADDVTVIVAKIIKK